jgi:shikimate kinase
MALCEKILIAGFSGAGKSSLVKILKSSAPEDWEFFDDLDQIILKEKGKGHADLASLIEAHGWEKFRLWERQCLESWLKEEGKGVLALGGGTLSPMIWELFGKQRKIKFCFLDVPFELALSRLSKDSNQPRPLLKFGEEYLRSIFIERKKIFSQISWKLDGTKNLGDLGSHFWKELE